MWRKQQELLEKQQKEAIAKSTKDGGKADQVPEVKAIETISTETSTSSTSTTSTASTSARPAAPTTPSTQKDGRVRQDAHKLPDADAFRPHFDAVMEAPRVTWQEAKDACKFDDITKVNFQFADGEGGFMLNTSWTLRPRPQQDHDEQRLKWHQHVKTGMLPWKNHSHKFEGRGIVIVGGSGRSVKRISVMMRQLARLNSKLPIEIHYWGREMDEDKKKRLTNLWPLLYFNDLSSPDNVYSTLYDDRPGRGIHYNLKTAALINTRFAEPLLLDSDNVPIIAPDSLWESEEYKEYGTVFWPDIARTRPDNPVWSITNTLCRTDEFEQESGQLLVNKKKFFYHLQLAAWINAPHLDANSGYQESYYYNFLLGDKDSFRFAWHALKTIYGRPNKAITSVGTNSKESETMSFFCGHSFLQYHPDGRPQFMHGGLLKTMQAPVMKWQRDNHGGIFQAYKKFDFDTDHTKTHRVYIGGDEMKYFADKEKYKMGPTFCTQYVDQEARPLEELAPRV
ncbi:glycosyltransferase family 71 protein [Dothistroma septosporum NZE10]|uniref:Glycosyltransferase family 71 protein n=1 Tax=Dothistroma septosporum (strain NZE10 / CBS 128990) TaxID=675120 RepID=N1PPU8_DOTSN|nr:glycosyltransferase family 71 protein [Dothistroma septosporum NZE10]